MKVYNPDHNEALKPALQKALDAQRKKRGFNPETWIVAKATLINDYLRKSGLKSVALGLSGGINSSVVTGLAVYASKMKDSPIQKVVPVMIPVFSEAASGQDTAVQRGQDVVKTYGLAENVVDLSAAHREMTAAVGKALGIEGDKWALGQAVAHTRTAALSYTLSLLSKDKTPGLLLGTTNRSEGAWLGYVGKYSDGMVDLQVISDLYKSEVYAVAHKLGLPKSVLDVTPTGDMYDARPDTAVFGASYDFVELYHGYLELSPVKKAKMLATFGEDELAQFNAMAANLENLHRYNAHKYTSFTGGEFKGAPAYHLDVQQSGVPGGWQTGLFDRPLPTPASTKPFVGYFDLSKEFLSAVENAPARSIIAAAQSATVPSDLHPKKVHHVFDLLTPAETDALLKETEGKNWEPVGDDGIKAHYEEGKTPVGSWRLSTYSPELAGILWDRLSGIIEMTRVIPQGSDIDAEKAAPGTPVWHATGINPLFRFIKYDPAGENRLVGHYDAPPATDLKENRTTLDSVIIYLTDTTPGTGGHTRFLKDPQAKIPAAKRDHSDWTRPGTHDEVIAAITPQKGLAAIFPHRVLHDSEPLAKNAGVKVIVRSDIVYKGVGTP